ncbi:MAG: peptidase E [Actinomycetota bacterium]|nr:peptidase E [Actinomycetota bacterium]
MRLYLSSFRLGEHPERLLALLDPPRLAAVIANAIDEAPDDVRVEGVQLELDALRGLGIDAEELDLRDYFGAPGRLAADLARFGLVWLRGGNTFMLRHALAESGADALLTDLLARDALVYAGYSAGCCVLAPSLRGLELVDEPEAVPTVYGVPATWEGLGVLEYAIVPHVDSPGHPETELCGRLGEHYRAQGVPHRTLRDGQALVIDGETEAIT